MQFKPIKTADDYNQALHDLETLWEAKEGTEAFDQLDILSTLIELYEEKAFPIPYFGISFKRKFSGVMSVFQESPAIHLIGLF